MEQERFMVIDNQKGVVIPLQSEKTISIDKVKGIGEENLNNRELEEKVQKIQLLIKALVKQSIKDTIKEYNLQLTEELREYEKNEMQRWDKLEDAELKRWEKLENKLEEVELKRWERLEGKMEEHFKTLDKNIRQKQNEGKRKKHSIF